MPVCLAKELLKSVDAMVFFSCEHKDMVNYMHTTVNPQGTGLFESIHGPGGVESRRCNLSSYFCLNFASNQSNRVSNEG